MTTALSLEHIQNACNRAAQRVAINVVAETGSTNVDLLADIDNLSGPTLLAAETQTAGKGRAGRTWHSEAGVSLTFSLAWKFNLTAQGLLGLPLAVGVAIAEVLQKYNVDVGLKWPNDVLRNDQKIAGMLIETAAGKGGGGSQVWAVIGIGLNLEVPDSLALKIGHPVASTNLPMDRNLLLAAILNNLSDTLAAFETYGFSAFRDRWNRLHAYGGRQVTIIDGGRVLHEGIALGVDDTGRLQLETAQGPMTIVAGDTSLRVKGE